MDVLYTVIRGVDDHKSIRIQSSGWNEGRASAMMMKGQSVFLS
jgi:hypothetical protein